METDLKDNDLKQKIIECAKNHKLIGLDKDLVERLEKDYFELCEFQRYYSNAKWTITSFFIMLSFAGCGYILQVGNGLPWMTRCGLLISLLLYWAGIILFWRRDRLSHAIRKYLETLGPLLGVYTHIYLKEYMKRPPKILEKCRFFKINTNKILFILGIIFTIIVIYAFYLVV